MRSLLDLDGINGANTLSICSGWIVDGLTINGRSAGGTSSRDQVFTLDAGERLTTIEGSHCGFENRQVIGRIKLTTSTGRIFGNVFLFLNVLSTENLNC